MESANEKIKGLPLVNIIAFVSSCLFMLWIMNIMGDKFWQD